MLDILKVMKKDIFWKILLICVLICTGWYLYDVVEDMKSRNPEPRAIESYNRLVFSDGDGIDVMGNKIDSVFTDKTDETERFAMAFLLRYDNLEYDLKFWNEVSSHLSEYNTVVRLTAYCENSRCIEAVKNNTGKAHFTVLEYGGILDMQAVIGADVEGELWLRGNVLRKIKWRDGAITPLGAVMSMGLKQ
jgi:hypothetical protein